MSKHYRVTLHVLAWPLSASLHRLVLRFAGPLDEVRTRRVCQTWNTTSREDPNEVTQKAIETLRARECTLVRMLKWETKTQLAEYWSGLGGTKSHARREQKTVVAKWIRNHLLSSEQWGLKRGLVRFVNVEKARQDAREESKAQNRIDAARRGADTRRGW